jgi:ABC-2 type transport system permease protein
MKYAVLVNPLVRLGGMRAAITPSLPHMPIWLVAVALLALSGLFWRLGMRSFTRRAIG